MTQNICLDCGNELGGSISVKTKSNGDVIRYYLCRSCESKFNATNFGDLRRTKIISPPNGVIKKVSLVNGTIKGARVFIDGKFIGIGK